MKWRFLDRIDKLEPCRSITGRKAVSLEEYDLLVPFGRKGVLPESLLLECAVAAGRWLACVSSDFRSTALLAEAETFRFERAPGPGDRIDIALDVADWDDDRIVVGATLRIAGETAASGRLALDLVPLAEVEDVPALKALSKELHGEA